MELKTFGSRLTEVRKHKKISQDELAKKIAVQGAVIGRYERDEVKPSIDMAAQIADALDVSLDYLTGNSDLLLDKNIVKRITDIQKLSDNDKENIFYTIDGLIKAAKLRGI